MSHWLHVVGNHGVYAKEMLIAEGYHPNVIYAKAEKSARKGYTDYGGVADRAWLTEKGTILYLEQKAPPVGRQGGSPCRSRRGRRRNNPYAHATIPLLRYQRGLAWP